MSEEQTSQGPAPPPDRLMEQAWQKWATAAIPAHASLQQRATMKTAFYCGAGVMLGMVLENLSDEEMIARVESLGNELAIFMRAIEAGIQVRQQADAQALVGQAVRMPGKKGH